MSTIFQIYIIYVTVRDLDVGPLLTLHHRDGDHPDELDHRSGHQQHSGRERSLLNICKGKVSLYRQPPVIPV